MINNQLLHPESIVVVGGSNDVTKPGGAVLRNLIQGGFKGHLYVTNPKETVVQGVKSYQDSSFLPYVDLAIIAIAAKFIPATIEFLIHHKNTRAFIVLSAGFSEENEEGRILEHEIVDSVNSVHGTLIGPNCIGVLTPQYAGVFTKPVPKLDPKGCDFISGSGATACFIMEAGIPNGLTFSSVYSVGNSAQVGVEEILAYMDDTYDPLTSSAVKLLYIENISKPQLLLKHASSLIRKGCKIAAIKAGSSEAGSRAASSHTGALASPDAAVDALFRKAGIVRCYGRQDLISVASIFMYPKPKGKNIAVITHAGGPAVMLTDALSNAGLSVPAITSPKAKELLTLLYPGSSVSNPVDFLATGTADQLRTIIDYTENYFDEIDGMAVIFGTPGLTKIHDVYKVLSDKIRASKKPIFPVLPSVLTAREEIGEFIAENHVFFPDEVVFGNALSRVINTPKPYHDSGKLPQVNQARIRLVIGRNQDGYLPPPEINELLDACGIPRANEAVTTTQEEVIVQAKKLGFPLVMKVIGPVHKSDVGGVVLGVKDVDTLKREFQRMIKIKDTKAILLQPLLSGTELFAGAKFEPKFGHLILCGMGGIFIEVMKDIASELSPVCHEEAFAMIRSLKSYKIIQGVRGQNGIDERSFADVIVRLSAMLTHAPEIAELDLNPLLGNVDGVIAVDARVRLQH